MRYWQHGDTGICCAVEDHIDLSRRHIEITKTAYDLHEDDSGDYTWVHSDIGFLTERKEDRDMSEVDKHPDRLAQNT